MIQFVTNNFIIAIICALITLTGIALTVITGIFLSTYTGLIGALILGCIMTVVGLLGLIALLVENL